MKLAVGDTVNRPAGYLGCIAPEDSQGEVIRRLTIHPGGLWLRLGSQPDPIEAGEYYCVRWSTEPLRWDWYMAEQLTKQGGTT